MSKLVFNEELGGTTTLQAQNTAANKIINVPAADGVLPVPVDDGLNNQVLTSRGASASPEWEYLAGTGTVTSVDGSGGATGLTLTGGPITVAGTLTLGGTLSPASGGTGAGELIGYMFGNGPNPASASLTIPNTDINGLGTMSTQDASAVAITGGTMSSVDISIDSQIELSGAPGTSGQVLTSAGAGVAPTWETPTTGTVTAVSVATANGLAGTSSGGATPALTLTTSVTGVVKGDGTSLSAATAGTDYLAPPSGTAILKANSGGALANATAGTDYVAPATATNFTAQQYFGDVALTDAATIAWAADAAQTATFTFVSTNRTMGAPTGLANGAFYALAVIQNAGSNTLTWNAVFKWTGGAAPTLSTAAGAKDFFVFRSDGTNLYEQGRSLDTA
jgi:hypothetical protein